MNENIELLERIMHFSCPELLNGLQPGLTDESISAVISDPALNLAPIRDLYRWRNGFSEMIRPNDSKYSFHPCGNFLPLQEAAGIKKEIEKEGLWDFRFFPIMTNSNSDYLLFDLEEGSPTFGMLFICSFTTQLAPPVSIYDSFSSFLNNLAQLYAMQGYVYRRRTHELEVNYEIERSLGKLINPKSEYWEL